MDNNALSQNSLLGQIHRGNGKDAPAFRQGEELPLYLW